MEKRHHPFIGYGIVVFFLSMFCFVEQGIHATLLDHITLTDQNSGTITIDTTTGRYLWPEIQYQQSNVSGNTQANNVLLYIPNSTILNTLATSDNYARAHERIRLVLLQAMISQGFSGFISIPFPDGNEKISLLANTGFVDFILLKDIQQKDALDNLIINKLMQYKNDITRGTPTRGLEITQDEYNALHDVYLFKSNEDLYKLGYEVVSYRYRTNHDAAYRRYNISLAFSKIGNIRIINPGETFSFQKTIQSTDQSLPENKGSQSQQAAGYSSQLT